MVVGSLVLEPVELGVAPEQIRQTLLPLVVEEHLLLLVALLEVLVVVVDQVMYI